MQPIIPDPEKWGKRPRNPPEKQEAKLQAECVFWYRNVWYKNFRHLWATFNEGQDVNTKESMGLMPGASDLIYKETPGRGLIPLELKFPGEDHEVSRIIRQAEFIMDVGDYGGFVDNLEQFQRIIQGENCWIDPVKVLKYCKSIKNKTLTWNKNLFEL
jgi:hypothetical protein